MSKQEPGAWGNVLPGGRITDAMESARVGDYNQGWNDYRKAAKVALEKLYSAPPQREWQGLTDDEIFDVAENFGSFQYGDAQGHKRLEYARAIEAAWKAKNALPSP